MVLVGEVNGRGSRELSCSVRKKYGGWRRNRKRTMIKEVVGGEVRERRRSSRYSTSERVCE
jgi:hypothetical protein